MVSAIHGMGPPLQSRHSIALCFLLCPACMQLLKRHRYTETQVMTRREAAQAVGGWLSTPSWSLPSCRMLLPGPGVQPLLENFLSSFFSKSIKFLRRWGGAIAVNGLPCPALLATAPRGEQPSPRSSSWRSSRPAADQQQGSSQPSGEVEVFDVALAEADAAAGALAVARVCTGGGGGACGRNATQTAHTLHSYHHGRREPLTQRSRPCPACPVHLPAHHLSLPHTRPTVVQSQRPQHPQRMPPPPPPKEPPQPEHTRKAARRQQRAQAALYDPPPHTRGRTQVAADALLAEHVPALGDDHVLLPLVAHVAADHGAQGGSLGLVCGWVGGEGRG
jgi:hypothetical protein